jgi:hypothetical protein
VIQATLKAEGFTAFRFFVGDEVLDLNPTTK